MCTISSIRSIEDSMKKFPEYLKQLAMKKMNFKKTKMNLLKKVEKESDENAKICYIYKEKFENKYLNDKKYC